MESLCMTFKHLTRKARVVYLDAEALKTRKLMCEYPRFITEYHSHIFILYHMRKGCMTQIHCTNVASQCATGGQLLMIERCKISKPGIL